MSLTLTILLVVQVLSALAIIVLVLLQQGKGADMGSAFGSGSAGSLFGATGAANFLSRSTKWAAVVFFATTLGLAYFSHKSVSSGTVDSGVMQDFPADRSVPQVPGSTDGSSVPQSTPAQPDASVPSVPVAPSSSAADAPAAAPAEPPSTSTEAPAATPSASDAPEAAAPAVGGESSSGTPAAEGASTTSTESTESGPAQ